MPSKGEVREKFVYQAKAFAIYDFDQMCQGQAPSAWHERNGRMESIGLKMTKAQFRGFCEHFIGKWKSRNIDTPLRTTHNLLYPFGSIHESAVSKTRHNLKNNDILSAFFNETNNHNEINRIFDFI